MINAQSRTLRPVCGELLILAERDAETQTCASFADG